MPSKRKSPDSPKVSDWMKKTLMTAMKQADRTKKDLSSLVAKEVRLFLDGIEVDELLRKVLAGQAIEISATIKFIDQEKAAPKAASKAKKT